ncbi:MAG: YkgJ family cysteine cluster protein [FCB group bacterium]|nr:YkgJ family cysteine cluster protein [FCB group bacterium]MBL7028564.1 YkgJ family cysteine cluster protein [Candidatus Neomarinimicrobiota bacterium]MBL7120783.1 YkgJ family cysteine cluster protein [Candidatus Neomarinimicrobiota bacterium]
MSESQDLETGNFSSWLSDTRTALSNDAEMDVPCGECNACCRSSYFIHIKPDEFDTVSHIPDELLFPAPGLPEGNVLMGYDEKGHCPMLKDGACSIYDHRPATCRSYDCRIFPATGIQISGKDKILISQQVQRWKFNLTEAEEIKEHKAVQKAASFLTHKSTLFPPDELPGNPTQLAIMAIKVHDLFLDQENEAVDDSKMVDAVITAHGKFDR